MYFQIFGLTITYYSICILLGIFAGYFIVSKRAKFYQIEEAHIDNLLVFTIPIAILFSRLYHVLTEWNYYSENLDKIFSLRMTGLSIFGAFVGALIVFIVYSRLNKINMLKLFDLGCVGLLAGQILGRFGNYFNKELYGYPTNLLWKVYIPLKNRISGFESFEYFHPTFFYEAVWNLIGLLFILFNKRFPLKFQFKKDGSVFSFYLFWYGVGRFLIGFLRIEEDDFWILNDGQIMAILFVITSLIFYARLNLSKNSSAVNR